MSKMVLHTRGGMSNKFANAQKLKNVGRAQGVGVSIRNNGNAVVGPTTKRRSKTGK